VDAARTVKLPTGAEKDFAVSVVVVRETTFPRFADKLEVVSDINLPPGADNDVAVIVEIAVPSNYKPGLTMMRL